MASDSIISLPVSIPVDVIHSYTIHCTDQSEHTFTFNNSVLPSYLHVFDPDSTNYLAGLPGGSDATRWTAVKNYRLH